MTETFACSLLILLAGHWLADFVFQSNYMACNKWNDAFALSLHGCVYIFVTMPFFILALPYVPISVAIVFCILNGYMHGLQDYITAPAAHYLSEKKMSHWFFVVIGADQFIHTALLVVITLIASKAIT